MKIARIRQLDKDLIPEAIEDMERYRAIATACTPKYNSDGAQHTAPATNSKEKAFAEYAEAGIKVDMLQDEIGNLKLEVKRIIDGISCDKDRRFSKLYYIDQLTQRKISGKTRYAVSTIKNSLRKARETLNIVPDNPE
jgi:hypothetical protein